MSDLTNMDKNCLSFWFPKIAEAGIPVPKTVIVRTDCRLLQLLGGDNIPDGWHAFALRLHNAAMKLGGYPVFLRTGHTAGKHNWKRSCWLSGRDDILHHVGRLVEESEMGLEGLPTNVWAVRELLPTEPICELPRYGGMPLCREFRCFARGGEVLCVHPYWPWDAVVRGFLVSGSGESIVPAGLPANWYDMGELDPRESAAVRHLASRATHVIGGEWSVDVFWTSRGWCVTDMALAADSWHWPTCERAVISSASSWTRVTSTSPRRG